MIDIDGNTYKTVIIGKQEWMAENLNVEHYRNGDPIPEVQDPYDWSALKTGAWCYYDNLSKYGKTRGKLYNGYAVNDSRGLTPQGWHIPSDEEWTILIDYAGGEHEAGMKLKAQKYWRKNWERGNPYGFSALPGGGRYHTGKFHSILLVAYFWTSPEHGSNSTGCLLLFAQAGNVQSIGGFEKEGCSVRCVKD